MDLALLEMNEKIKIFDNFPILKIDNTLILRELNLDQSNINDFLEIYSNPAVCKYIPCYCLIFTKKEAESEILFLKSLFYQKKSIYWAIEFKKKLVGTIGFNNLLFEHKIAEIACEINEKFWNLGIATKSIKEIINFLLKKTNISILNCQINKDNVNSIKLFKKLNFKKEEGIDNDQILKFKYLLIR